jgi:cell division protein FtsW
MSQISQPVGLKADNTGLVSRPRLLNRLLGAPSATTVLIAASGLLCIGAVMVISAQPWRQVIDAVEDPQVFGAATLKLVGFVAAAMATMVLVSRIDHRWLSQPWIGGIRPVTWLLFISAALVALTLVPHVGVMRNGRIRWLSLGIGIQFQPSELAKIALVLWLSERFGSGRKSIRKFWLGLLPSIVVMGGICYLVAREDLGTAALMGLVSLAVLTAAGMNWILLFCMTTGAGVAVRLLIKMEGYRQKRLEAHKDIWADPTGKGYQAVQSLLAIVAGGWGGVGFGSSMQKFGYLPEASSDFIFALICEEMGFLGAAVVIVLFATIVWQGACIVRTCKDDFGKLAAFGIALTIGMQAAMNIAVVTVTVPTKGIALPLVSAGGTSLIVTAAAVGLLASIARAANGNR